MVTKVISELKSVSRLKTFSRNWTLVCDFWLYNKWSKFWGSLISEVVSNWGGGVMHCTLM